MKILIVAFILSLILHLLFLKNYRENIVENKPNSTLQNELQKTDIKFVKLTPLQNTQSKTEIKTTKKREQKENKSKKLIKAEKPKFQQKTQKKEKKRVKKPIEKAIVKNEEKFIPQKIEEKKEVENKTFESLEDAFLSEQKVKNKKTIEEKTLEKFLSQKESVNKKVLNEINKLYGKEFETFTNVQKAFLVENLNQFRSITQTVLYRLGYPRLASKLRMSGVNTVEFIFHPNGDITNLKITNSSGYEILDEYTMKLIQKAYKDYPKPKESTKLKFRVYYNLY